MKSKKVLVNHEGVCNYIKVNENVLLVWRINFKFPSPYIVFRDRKRYWLWHEDRVVKWMTENFKLVIAGRKLSLKQFRKQSLENL